MLRIGGPSQGADRMTDQARAQGKPVYAGLGAVPDVAATLLEGRR